MREGERERGGEEEERRRGEEERRRGGEGERGRGGEGERGRGGEGERGRGGEGERGREGERGESYQLLYADKLLKATVSTLLPSIKCQQPREKVTCKSHQYFRLGTGNGLLHPQYKPGLHFLGCHVEKQAFSGCNQWEMNL